MDALAINGHVWRVVRVPAGDPRLIDRTGTERLATTDPSSQTISILDTVQPPLLDKVVLHEVTHAITVSHGLLGQMRSSTPPSSWVPVEEWAVQIVENHAIEALRMSRKILGRPVCIRGDCFD